jgi:hypothetical protein
MRTRSARKKYAARRKAQVEQRAQRLADRSAEAKPFDHFAYAWFKADEAAMEAGEDPVQPLEPAIQRLPRRNLRW